MDRVGGPEPVFAAQRSREVGGRTIDGAQIQAGEQSGQGADFAGLTVAQRLAEYS